MFSSSGGVGYNATSLFKTSENLRKSVLKTGVHVVFYEQKISVSKVLAKKGGGGPTVMELVNSFTSLTHFFEDRARSQ